MATIGASVLTLVDAAKRKDPDGSIASIAELLAETNEILEDMPWMEGNMETGHRVSVRTGIPTPTWRLINQGVTPAKSTTAQSTESTAMLEAYSEVDKALADMSSDLGGFRLSEAAAFLEGMNQEMAATLFYGARTAPEEFVGLAPRYNDLGANNAQNIIDAGGSGSDNSSIWLVIWHESSVFGIYPKGSTAGLSHRDLGEVTVEVTAGIAGNRMQAYRDHWKWDAGIVLKDWRQVVRIANIDVSDLDGGSAADLPEEMIKAMYRPKSLTMGKACWYMNRTCLQYLDLQRRADVITGGGLTYDNVDGRRIPFFRGIPIRICDQLTEAEAQVT
jgi:hypothetical protein